MKTFSCIFPVALVICLSLQASAQVTNLIVNGSSTSFTMTSGDTIHWEYDIPTGQTAIGEVWLDVNDNQVIDQSTDKNIFLFPQTDGDPSGEGGPPDVDGVANGHVVLIFPVGLAPQKYILKFTHNNAGEMVAGTILPLPSPDFTISGTVTPPSGYSAQYILVEASRDTGDGIFWDGLTDVNGNYTIAMLDDGNPIPWRIRVENQLPPHIVTPAETTVANGSSHTGINFTFQQAAAQVVGYLKDDNDMPIFGENVYIARVDTGPSGAVYDAQTDASGYFQIGVLASDLIGHEWWIAEPFSQERPITTHLLGYGRLPVLNSGDSIVHNLTAYKVNSSIQGQVLIDGNAPNFSIMLLATNLDSCQSFTYSDSGTGTFTMLVTDKVYNYSFDLQNLPFGYFYNKVIAHPGDTGVLIAITTTSVKEREPGIPDQFALKQNYPNPFNPRTTIDYDLASASYVQLSIFNVLGNDVMQLVHQNQTAGKYTVSLDASTLPSGIYFYRLTVVGNGRSFSSMKKMILMK
ncbi:MAG: T9SS type A sorting domain-containing protein [Ignavibacteriae bacterium]|nr:T9SS type A sorting domain-containing protein [Ignavibacteriota bacterium]